MRQRQRSDLMLTKAARPPDSDVRGRRTQVSGYDRTTHSISLPFFEPPFTYCRIPLKSHEMHAVQQITRAG
jgi:hypothetical protein